MTSPWGKVDQVDKIMHGVSFVGTPSHGGLRITSKIAMKLLSPEVIKRGAIALDSRPNPYLYFEEDCALPLALYSSEELLKAYVAFYKLDYNGIQESVKNSVARWYPELLGSK